MIPSPAPRQLTHPDLLLCEFQTIAVLFDIQLLIFGMLSEGDLLFVFLIRPERKYHCDAKVLNLLLKMFLRFA